jgi:hypothetical protein
MEDEWRINGERMELEGSHTRIKEEDGKEEEATP